MVVIGFWLWFITMIAMLFIPVYDLIKGRIMTPRELLFFIIGVWAGSGYYVLCRIFI